MLLKIMRVVLILLLINIAGCAKKQEFHYASQDSSLSYVMERVVDKTTDLESILEQEPNEDVPIYLDMENIDLK